MKEKIKNFETSKILAIWLFILLNSIIIYSLVAMWHFSDLSFLNALISEIGAQILVYAIYCLKAYHGKKNQERLRFERFKIQAEEGEIEEGEDE